MDIRRTIEDVYDLENGKEVSASVFFKRSFDKLIQDRELQELANKGKRDRWLVCATCGENIRILGGKREEDWNKPGKNFHFAHLHNSKDCPIKTDSKYSREDINRMRYRGIAEGKPHIELKEKLYQGLNRNSIHKGQVSELQLERVIRSLDEAEWRKPDINLLFNGRRLAVELQLSTTWLDVIVGRQAFYRQEGIFILWIFNEFDYKDSTRKLAYSDIIYTNNYNAYVFDEEARTATLREKDLVLKCYYQHHYAEDDRALNRWEHRLVKLEDLTFDPHTMKVFYRDIAAEKHEAAESVRKYKAKKQKEIDDRRGERNRLRRVRSGYQSDHKEKRAELTATEKDIEKLERQLGEQQRKLNSVQTDLFNILVTAQEISSRLDGYWYSLPPKTSELKNKLKEKQKQLETSIKHLEERHQKLSSKDDYYRKGRVKRLNGKEYHVLDRANSWEYITNNPDKVLAYPNDQANNLFASPELQVLNSHKIMQMRHNLNVEFVIDLSGEFAENTVALNAAEAQLTLYRNESDEMRSTLPGLFEKALREEYTHSINAFEKEAAAVKVQLEAKRTERDNLKKEADDIFYEIVELDYLDDYDEEDRYH
jgi:competence CoiA-like predicted nuclease